VSLVVPSSARLAVPLLPDAHPRISQGRSISPQPPPISAPVICLLSSSSLPSSQALTSSLWLPVTEEHRITLRGLPRVILFEDARPSGFPPRGSNFFLDNSFGVVQVNWTRLLSLAVISYLSVNYVVGVWLLFFLFSFLPAKRVSMNLRGNIYRPRCNCPCFFLNYNGLPNYRWKCLFSSRTSLASSISTLWPGPVRVFSAMVEESDSPVPRRPLVLH
jgi:hypothetical protein